MRPFLVLTLSLYVLLLPFERVLKVVGDGEDSVLKPYRLVGITMFLGWFLWTVARGRRPRFDQADWTYLTIFSLGGVLALFWSLFEVNNLDYTARGLQLIAFGYLTFLVTRQLELTRREVEQILALYCGIEFVAVALAQVVTEEGSERFRAFYRNPNQLGQAAAFVFVYTLYRFVFSAQARSWLQLGRVTAATGALALVGLSGSRGAASGATVGALLIIVSALLRLSKGDFRVTRVAMFAALLGLMVTAGYSRFEAAWEQSSAQTRFREDVAREGAEGRWDLWRSGYKVGIEHYGIGVGSHQYLSYHLQSMKDLGIPIDSRDRPLGTHSDYVDLFASYGVVGLLLFLRYKLGLGLGLLRAARDSGGATHAPLALALLGVILTIAVAQNSFIGPEYWFIMSLVASIARLNERGSEASAQSEVAAGPTPSNVVPAFVRRPTPRSAPIRSVEPFRS